MCWKTVPSLYFKPKPKISNLSMTLEGFLILMLCKHYILQLNSFKSGWQHSYPLRFPKWNFVNLIQVRWQNITSLSPVCCQTAGSITGDSATAGITYQLGDWAHDKTKGLSRGFSRALYFSPYLGANCSNLPMIGWNDFTREILYFK